MIQLRPYQNEAIQKIKEYFKTKDSQFIELPTGSGKTITFLTYAVHNHDKILIIVPSKELLRQVYETSLNFYHKSEISRKGAGFDEDVKKIHIGIINSMKYSYLNLLQQENFDLIIFDEAHHIQANSYLKILKSLTGIKTLGVTATPDRTDGKFIRDILGERTYVRTIANLIQDKHLSDIEGFIVKTNINISNVHHHNGDFSLTQLFKKLCIESRNKLILGICKDEMKNRKTLIFCINIEHSKIINKLLNDNGLSSHHIDGTMNSTERSSILSAFRKNEINFLCNCQLLTEGFDEPTIDGIIIARPTISRSLFLQMIGRGLRISKGKKNCKIVDIVDNHNKIKNFCCISSDEKCKSLASFKTIHDILKHIEEEKVILYETSLQKKDLLDFNPISTLKPTESMFRYLDENNLKHDEYSNFDEIAFLIWLDQLIKQYEKETSNKGTLKWLQ